MKKKKKKSYNIPMTIEIILLKRISSTVKGALPLNGRLFFYLDSSLGNQTQVMHMRNFFKFASYCQMVDSFE